MDNVTVTHPHQNTFCTELNSLGDDVLLYVLQYFSLSDLSAFQLTSQSLRICQLTQHEIIWKTRYENYESYDYLQQLSIQPVTEKFKQAYIARVKRELTDAIFNSPIGDEKHKHDYIGLEALLSQTINTTLSNIKCSVIGEQRAGKTSLVKTIMNLWEDGFENEKYYIPVLDIQTAKVEGKEVGFWDSLGNSEYDRLRPLGYPGTSVFLVCFHVFMPKQKEFYCDDNHNFITTYLWLAAKKFVVEARRHCPNAPCILVGTKTDLRDVGYQLDKQRYLPSVFGEYVARETGCLAYIETSSKTEQGIDELKRAIVRIQTQPEKKKKCELM